MLVGISETIRSLSVYNLYFIKFIKLNLFRLFSSINNNNNNNDIINDETNIKIFKNNLIIKNSDPYTIHSNKFFE
jgi:hypothetical protein